MVESDYRSSSSGLEFHSYGHGHLLIFNGWHIECKERRPARSSDCITIYLNGRRVGTYRDKSGALNMVHNLLAACPNECKEDVGTHAAEYILQHLT